jgi:PhnB protein
MTNLGGDRLVPWLSVADASAAVEFYGRAFGLEVREQLDGDGTVQVARLGAGDVEIWVQLDEGAPPADRPIRLIIATDDPDTAFARAVDAGATEVNAMTEEHGWRTGRVADPFGHHWELARIQTA